MADHHERSAPSARTVHDASEHLTFAQAGERMHISPNAVRMRVHRGTLASVRVNDRTFVLWPQPARVHEQRSHDARAVHEATVHETDAAALIARLESENAYLRQTLDAEIEARRRADHLVAGLVERVRELPASVEDAPQDAQTAPQSDVHPRMAPRPSQPTYPLSSTPVSDTLALGWRRWWRRMTGGG